MFIDLVNQLWDPWLAPWLQAHWNFALSPAQNTALHFNGALTWLTLPAIFCLALARRALHLHTNLVSERNQLEVRVAQRTRELSSANQELAFQASTDALTGLLNRRRMMSQIEHEVERSRRYKLPLSLCMIDIDHFKRVNDSHGHLAGDRALVAVAGLLSGSLRDSDQIARFGGEEFVLLLPETDAALAQGLVDRLRLAVADLQLHADEGIAFTLTISGGIAELDIADHCDDAARMLMRADQALYGAKSGGRNCVKVAHQAA
jgi:diguanylate cyclase (GGDEF)-like protein